MGTCISSINRGRTVGDDQRYYLGANNRTVAVANVHLTDLPNGDALSLPACLAFLVAADHGQLHWRPSDLDHVVLQGAAILKHHQSGDTQRGVTTDDVPGQVRIAGTVHFISSATVEGCAAPTLPAPAPDNVSATAHVVQLAVKATVEANKAYLASVMKPTPSAEAKFTAAKAKQTAALTAALAAKKEIDARAATAEHVAGVEQDMSSAVVAGERSTTGVAPGTVATGAAGETSATRVTGVPGVTLTAAPKAFERHTCCLVTSGNLAAAVAKRHGTYLIFSLEGAPRLTLVNTVSQIDFFLNSLSEADGVYPVNITRKLIPSDRMHPSYQLPDVEAEAKQLMNNRLNWAKEPPETMKDEGMKHAPD